MKPTPTLSRILLILFLNCGLSTGKLLLDSASVKSLGR